MPKLTMPGALLVGDAAGMVDTAALKGVHHCIKSGILAAEAIYASLKGEPRSTPTRRRSRARSIGKELYQVRNTRQPFQKGFLLGSLLAGPSIMSKGKVPPGRQAWHRDDAEPMFVGDTPSAIPSPTASTLRQALERLHLGQRDPRRRPQPHPGAQAGPTGDRRDVAMDVPRWGI